MKILLLSFFISIVFPQNNKLDWTKRKDLFVTKKSKHFLVNYFDSTYVSENISKIISEREKSYNKLQDFFNLPEQLTVNIYLFPDEQIKFDITGHKGLGWGFENNIIEVYNDSIQLNPYHELAHIFIYHLGKPSPMIDEGLAVYLSEKLGEKYFAKLVGYPNKSLLEIFKTLTKNSGPIDFDQLFNYEKISESDNVPLAYIQSSLFVEYLLENFGKEKLLDYLGLLNHVNNDKYIAFKEIYGATFRTISAKWLESLTKK